MMRLEDAVEDRTSILIGALAGAVIGGAVGYLLFTERGRRLREDLEPRIMDVIAELGRARAAADVARETLADVPASTPSPEPARGAAPASSPGWR